MRRYALGIAITTTLIITSILLLQKTDSSLLISKDRSTSGQIKNGMKLGTTHEIESLDGKVVVGDDGSNNFEPVVTLSKLDDSAYLKVNYPINSDQVVTTENTITWKGKDQDLYFKQPTPDSFEFDILLHKKPSINTFAYSIDTQNLDFFYQPQLTQEEITKGNERPEKVIGSYAVYYKNGLSGDYSGIGGLDYKTGKAFHIYRPKIEDSTGKSVWGELTINTEENKLLVKVPQEFLDMGTYPIIVDPTFGYTSQGGTDSVLCGSASDNKVAMRADSIAGILTNISAYIKTQNGASNADYRMEEFPDSSNKPGTVEAQGAQTTYNGGSYQLWSTSFNFNMATGTHWVAVGGIKTTSDNCRVAYDSGGTTNYGATFDSGAGSWVNDSNRYSVYATYTQTFKTNLKGNINLKGNVNLK